VRPELQVICEASDGSEAIQKSQELKPDLILLDISLPKLNGIEAARQIRHLSPSSKIIFLSSNNSLDVVQEALEPVHDLFPLLQYGHLEMRQMRVDVGIENSIFVHVTYVPYIAAAGEGFDVHIVEIGGTVGDLESQSFLEGIREFGLRVGFDPVGRDGQSLVEAWQAGPRTLYGLQSAGFPNLFFLGIVQGGNTINYTHMADEQARHIAYIVSQTRNAAASVVEPTTDAVEGWLAEMRSKAPGLSRVKDCTPSYTNSEGDTDNPHSLDNTRYGGGPVLFFEMLARWREDGRLEGLKLR